MLKIILGYISILVLVTGLFAIPASADWAGLVRDDLFMQQPRTLKGKAFLDHPISGATVRIYDRSGGLLYSVSSATGADGSFSITRPFPESFKVVINGGFIGGEAFVHEISAFIPKFDEGPLYPSYPYHINYPYKINAVTTLLTKYMDGHPEDSYLAAKEAVKKFLSVSGSVDLEEIIYSSEWYCYYFSHYLFMKDLEPDKAMSSFVDQLIAELEQGKTRSYYDGGSIGSSLFQDAMAELLKGAASEVGSQGAGWILGLLNKGGNDTDSRLDEMKTELDAILNDLEQIKSALAALSQELAMDTNQVETYIQGLTAQEAITTIMTYYGPADPNLRGDTNTLKYYSLCTAETCQDVATKTAMQNWVNNSISSWEIEEQVQIIHDAIVPNVPTTEGLLDLWTDAFILKGPVNSDQLMDYYKTLEQYFAVLLFYQFKGANMVVEGKNYQGTKDAADYMATFQALIKDETDKFLNNVIRLIARNSGLYWESSFLPNSAQDILGRANFFITQTLGEDHYGLRLGALGTNNLVNDILLIGAIAEIAPDTYKWISSAGTKTNVDLADRPYDFWGTLNTPNLGSLQTGTTYTLLSADLGAFDPGTYEVTYSTETNPRSELGNAVVKTYTSSYIEDPTGTISYGYLLSPFRIGGKEAMMDPSAFARDQYPVNVSGDVNFDHLDWLTADNQLELKLSANNHYSNSGSSISQELEWGHSFKFNGTKTTTAYINIAGALSGSVYFRNENNWNNDASIAVHVGLWDATNQKVVSSINYGTSALESGTLLPWKQPLNDQISVTLTPGVSYGVFVNVTGAGENGSGDFSYEIHMNNLTHLSLTFVNSEF